MVIDINKNIDNYKETVVLGLTAKQLIYSILSVAVGGGIVLLLYQKVGRTVSQRKFAVLRRLMRRLFLK